MGMSYDTIRYWIIAGASLAALAVLDDKHKKYWAIGSLASTTMVALLNAQKNIRSLETEQHTQQWDLVV